MLLSAIFTYSSNRSSRVEWDVSSFSRSFEFDAMEPDLSISCSNEQMLGSNENTHLHLHQLDLLFVDRLVLG